MNNDHTPDPLDDWAVPVESADGKRVARRTIVMGAAWTIPVIALAVATPLAAASGASPTLAFTNGPYAVTACATLGDVIIQLTTDGTTPAGAGQSVVVSLPDGVTWSDGSTADRVLSTNALGQAVATGLRAPASNAGYTISASSGSVVAVAPVIVTGAVFGLYVNEALTEPDAVTVAEGVNGYVFVKADGSVWQRTTNSGAAVQVAPAGTNPTQILASTWNPGGSNAAYYLAGGALFWDGGPTESATIVSVSPGSNGYIFVKSDGSIWERTISAPAATQIAPPGTNPSDLVASTWGPAGLNQAVYVSNGVVYYANSTGITPNETGVASVAAGPNGYVFVKSDGSIWQRTINSLGAVQVAPAGTTASAVVAGTWVTDGTNVPVYISNGTIYYGYDSGPAAAESDVVSISAGVNGYVFVKRDGSVWQHTTNTGAPQQIAPVGTNPSGYIASTWNPNGLNVAYYTSGTRC